MARREEHLPLNKYSRNLPEGTFLTRDVLANRYVIKTHGRDGRPVPLGTVREDDPLCWRQPAKTFAFAARHALRQWRAAEKKRA